MNEPHAIHFNNVQLVAEIWQTDISKPEHIKQTICIFKHHNRGVTKYKLI